MADVAVAPIADPASSNAPGESPKERGNINYVHLTMEEKGFKVGVTVEEMKAKYRFNIDSIEGSVVVLSLADHTPKITRTTTIVSLIQDYKVATVKPVEVFHGTDAIDFEDAPEVIGEELKGVVRIAMKTIWPKHKWCTSLVDIQWQPKKSITAARDLKAGEATFVGFTTSIAIAEDVPNKDAFNTGLKFLNTKTDKDNAVFLFPKRPPMTEDIAKDKVIPYWLVGKTPDADKANLVPSSVEVAVASDVGSSAAKAKPRIVQIPIMTNPAGIKAGTELFFFQMAEVKQARPSVPLDCQVSTHAEPKKGVRRSGTPKTQQAPRKRRTN